MLISCGILWTSIVHCRIVHFFIKPNRLSIDFIRSCSFFSPDCFNLLQPEFDFSFKWRRICSFQVFHDFKFEDMCHPENFEFEHFLHWFIYPLSCISSSLSQLLTWIPRSFILQFLLSKIALPRSILNLVVALLRDRWQHLQHEGGGGRGLVLWFLIRTS